MRRPALISILVLTLGAVVFGFFAWRESVRATETETLLMRDYASFVADNVIRYSSQRYLEHIGVSRYEQPEGRPSTLALVRESMPLPAQAADQVVQYFFAFDSGSSRLETSGAGPGTLEREQLIDLLNTFDPACGPNETAPFTGITGSNAGPPVAGLVRTDREAKVRAVYGFRLNPALAAEAFVVSVINAPNNCDCGRTLLPASLSSIRNNPEAASFRLRDEAGHVLFESKPDYADQNHQYTVGRPFLPDTPFRTWTLDVTMNPAVVRPLLPYGGKGAPWLALAFVGTLVLGSSLLAVRSFRRDGELLRLRQNFVSNVSHELRTPLARIRLFNELLMLDRQTNPQKKSDYRSVIDRECRRLTLLVQNILDFSRQERGARKYASIALDLRRVVEDGLEMFRAASDSSRFALSVSLENVPSIQGDAPALQQALMNLLDNAVKYSPPDSAIEVTLGVSEAKALLRVRDHGYGIPENERQRIFEEFYRVESGNNHNTVGSGLGLALVRRTVEAHQGRVYVDSEIGKGSTFTIELPIALNV